MKEVLAPSDFKLLIKAVEIYKGSGDFDTLTEALDNIFRNKQHLRYVMDGLSSYLSDSDRKKFETYRLRW